MAPISTYNELIKTAMDSRTDQGAFGRRILGEATFVQRDSAFQTWFEADGKNVALFSSLAGCVAPLLLIGILWIVWCCTVGRQQKS